MDYHTLMLRKLRDIGVNIKILKVNQELVIKIIMYRISYTQI